MTGFTANGITSYRIINDLFEAVILAAPCEICGLSDLNLGSLVSCEYRASSRVAGAAFEGQALTSERRV